MPHRFSDWRLMVPPMSPAARSLERDGYLLFAAALAVQALFFYAMMRGGWARKMQTRIERLIPYRWAAAPAVVLWYLLLYRLTLLPLSYAGYRVDREYGVSVETFARWSLDTARSWGVDFLVSAPALIALLWMIRRWPFNWWIAGSVGMAVLSAVMVYLAPLVIDPLFHTFRPMPATPLRASILELARRSGVKVKGVYVGEFSATTTEGNAYVTGLGGSHRIVLWDTTLKRYNPAELKAIVAHELGHYALHHILYGLALAVAGTTLTLALLARLLLWWQARGWIHKAGEPASLIPLAAVVLALNMLGLPAMNAVSRMMENAADAFSLRITNRPDWFIEAMQKLSRQDFADPYPNPVAKVIFYTHPSISERIEHAARYAEERRIALPASLLIDRSGSDPAQSAR